MKSPILTLLLLAAPVAAAGQCLSTDDVFHIEVKEYCNYEALLVAFETYFATPGMIPSDCENTAEQELLLLLNSANATEAEQTVYDICTAAFVDSDLEVEFETSTGNDKRFVEEFYKGNTDWNEQTATLVPPYDGPADEFTNKNKYESDLLQRDAHVVDEFHETEARRNLVEFPDYLPNFDQCDLNAVYCCWPRDRQANDGNGNCASPYDYRCIDADPADNTDLCFVDHRDGANVTGFESDEGFFTFPFDDANTKDNAEGAIHCHGFAWADDINDPSHVYRGNNLFFVSLYDHMHQRGYVQNIPSAPMCACAEQMPTVTRSDCTQIDFEEQEHDFIFSYTAAGLTAKIDKLFIEFNACDGVDEYGNDDDNDLWSHMNQLYLEDKIAPEKLQGLRQKLVGDKNCITAEKRALAKHGLVRGFDEELDDGDWLILAGRDAFMANMFYEKTTFDFLLGSVDSQLQDDAILRRACPSCYYDHKWLYYKRLTAVPADLDLLHDLKYGQAIKNGNVYGDDFLIYGTYEDAVNEVNAWECPNYNYKEGFPGDCAPNGSERRFQASRFNSRSGKPDVAWYVESKERELKALDNADVGSAFSGMTSQTVGYNKHEGSAYLKGDQLVVVAAGADIWGDNDKFRFTYGDASGDLSLTVKVGSISYREAWTKAGLMVRDSLDPGAKHFTVFLSGKNGFRIQYRPVEGGQSFSKGVTLPGEHEDVWLKLLKRGDEFSGFYSLDGEEWVAASQFIKMQMLSEDNMGDLKVGLAVTSHHASKVTEVTFSDYSHNDFQAPSAAPSSSPAPSHVHSDAIADTTFRTIGWTKANRPASAALQGSKTIIKVASSDLSSTNDRIAFASESITGDFVATVHIATLSALNTWAKFGLMARASDAGGSQHVSTILAPNKGTFFYYRQATDAGTTKKGHVWYPQQRTWFRLVREGDTFTGYRSIVGDTEEECDWYQLYKVTVDMPDTIDVGMVGTSRNNNQYASAEFDHFHIEQAAANVRGRGLRGSG